MVRDVGLAEELAQDALVTALSEWPKTGVPRNPGAWLMAAAKRRAIDGLPLFVSLQPPPDAGLVGEIDVTELALEIGLLAGDHAVADDEIERHQ